MLSRSYIAGLTRWWPLAVGIFAVVALGATFRTLGPGADRVYTSSAEAMVVALPPPGEVGTLDATLVWQHEEATARHLARSGYLNTIAFGEATAEQVGLDTAGAPRLDARKVAAALTASHDGNVLRLTVRWPGSQAREIAVAATEVLTRQAAAASGLPTEDRGHLAVRDRLDVPRAASLSALDPAVERERLIELASRLGAGVVLAIAAALAAELISERGSGGGAGA